MSKKPNSYRVRNWAEYNAGLKQRGSITFWLDEEAVKTWLNQGKTGKRGAPRALPSVASCTYSDLEPIRKMFFVVPHKGQVPCAGARTCVLEGFWQAFPSTSSFVAVGASDFTDRFLAIETVAMIKSVYGLAGHQAVGFVASVFALMKIDLAVPEHSTVSRRLASLKVELSVVPKDGERHVGIDATGIKIYGEGEWKTRQHGVSKRRTWRKLHLAVDEATGEILAVEVTGNDKKDGQLLESIELGIEQVSADGAYDQRDCYDTLIKKALKLQFHHAKVPRFGSTVTRKQRLTPETKIYVPSENTDARSGNAYAAITVAPSLKLPCSASSPVSARKPFLNASIIKSVNSN